MEKRLDAYFLLTLLIVQCAICIPVLNLFPISLDEPFSIFQAQKSFSELWELFPSGNNPMGHFLILKGWVNMFGIGPVAVRSLSVIVSLITLFVIYKFARKFLKANLAFVVCLLFILLRVNHYVAMEARMYGFFTLFFILILRELYSILVADEVKPILFIRLAIWNALLLYMHYLGLAILLFEGILILFYIKKWSGRTFIFLAISLLITLLIYLPQINFLILRMNDVSEAGTWVETPILGDLWVNLVKLGNNQFTLIAMLVLIIGWRIYLKYKPVFAKNPSTHFFLLWFLVGYIGLFVISLLFQPFFFIKYLQFLTVPLVFIAVGWLSKLELTGWHKIIPYTLLIPVLLSFKLVPSINRDTDRLVEYVLDSKTSTSIVYYCPPHYQLTLAYHANKDAFKNYHNTEELMSQDHYIPVYGANDLAYTNGFDRIIYIDFDSGFLYPNNGILDRLNNTRVFIDSREFKGNFKVYLFGSN